MGRTMGKRISISPAQLMPVWLIMGFGLVLYFWLSNAYRATQSCRGAVDAAVMYRFVEMTAMFVVAALVGWLWQFFIFRDVRTASGQPSTRKQALLLVCLYPILAYLVWYGIVVLSVFMLSPCI